MTRTYNLDTKAALEANSGGNRITESGPVEVTLKFAFGEANANGTELVSLFGVTDDGRETGLLTLYTHNADGKELFSYKTLMALMTCAKVRSLTPKPTKVELYDFDSKAMKTFDKQVFQELVNKRLGLVLIQEEYRKQDGSVGTRLQIQAPFEAGTRLMAAEILAKGDGPKVAKQLEGVVAWVEKNPVKKLKGNSGGSNQAPAPQGGDDYADVDFGDDQIPF